VPFEAYTIDENNQMKSRDEATVLEDFPVLFEVKWHDTALQLTSGITYTRMADELIPSENTVPVHAIARSSLVYLEGQNLNLSAYQIRSSNCFRSRDLGTAL
jgi:hypothetical protein